MSKKKSIPEDDLLAPMTLKYLTHLLQPDADVHRKLAEIA
jgi:hypothetical protein